MLDANFEEGKFAARRALPSPLIWTTLYGLMGIAAFLVWEKDAKKREVKRALTFFFIQLVLNSVWSIIFFGLRNPTLALGEIVILWLLIFKTTVSFYKILKPTGYLLMPYLAWVTFAAFLNLSIVLLNS
ncbi:hypothetical protein A3A66_04045 [Microgenomates group bacterium RIFCSPLOWO2_01_FULL_46_13]|nr:MAG: hypothetical protein A2783_05515 [Microgenomates group bacterium RIFCSPHIGHO2_01_FULL_45_11]OGV94958.1 MAG: hypothetical protein A3A66_04045 [Microgenomates group bacterium RIFCSPLOWO2_01_FULL_46_13]